MGNGEILEWYFGVRAWMETDCGIWCWELVLVGGEGEEDASLCTAHAG